MSKVELTEEELIALMKAGMYAWDTAWSDETAEDVAEKVIAEQKIAFKKE